MIPLRASVAIPRPLRRLFTYEIPPALRSLCRPGVRVVVPFGSRRLTGYVLDIAEAELLPVHGVGLRAVEQVLDREPVLDEAILTLTRWAADYYVASQGEMIRAALPGMNAMRDPHIALTPKGEAALQAPLMVSADAPTREALAMDGARRILDAVMRASRGTRSGATLPVIRRRLGNRYDPAVLDTLLKCDLLREVTSGSGRDVRPKLREFVHLTGLPPSSEPLRGARQRALIDLLTAAGAAVDTESLLRDSGASRASLLTLKRRGLVTIESREVARRPAISAAPAGDPASIRPSSEQAAVIATLGQILATGRHAPCLLHGVTGSGKTEVYLSAIDAVLSSGRSALYLVPEIGLTPLLARRMKRRFGDALAMLHSGLSDGERHDEWRRIRSASVRVVLGTRSAVFAPLRQVGMIVVDEEHDASYKQDEHPRYHARDLAIVRARMANAVALLGSATPSMETYRRAIDGHYRLLSLPERVGGSSLPEVECVDMRQEFRDVGRESALSRRLVTAIHDRLARREQTLILLNRRGFSTFVLCRSCGEQINCRRCSVGMTLHRRESTMRCHYCDDRRPVPDRCPACGGAHMHFGGTGTERLEDHLRELFPNARVERMDRDTVGSRGAAERILTRVERGEVDILLGTQMISKGHDFPNVTLVGVVGADALLGLPDFRAAERTYQLLSQVAGRSGRRTRSGQVIIQAYDAGHYAIAAACRHDFAGFAREELRYRRIMNYPPFTALALVMIRHRDQESAHAGAAALAQRLRAYGGGEIQVFGPAPAPLERLRGKYRVQILLKGSTRRSVQATLATLLHDEGESGRAVGDRVIDVDPMSTM